MDFDDRAELDASQVDDVGSSGMSRGGGLAIGGGAVGIVVLVLALVFGVDPSKLLSDDSPPAQTGRSGDLSAQCKTGADADQSEKCRVVGVVNSLQKYWKGQVDGYQQAKTTLFTGAIRTGCGAADSSVGPFYCSADRRIYLDLGFFDELHSQFGAEGGPFAQAYVIAHEYGHHVQNLLGDIAKGTGQGASSGSVRLELQADCYAGVWAKNAVSTGFYAKPFDDTDIRQALDAAAAVGDDRIQEKARGRVSPENFTHGTSAQRMKWFKKGYSTGDPRRCDTFSGAV
ncbi:neutral zinc metallopeptidase [Microtetraspora sp. AC03309]|uniref:KPN_02809 family neutral zinc metallopeptidase n=1 Tax=Microtetraspora sp. AC03309 TaxID=2779376 RepID=UPI001E36A928|nr:neutral zinc metallopeptidase [Microtetraspora sp. AC03309]MCC5576923.1 neutral zinc metallopeptidase [Microtetraspora sp. AC03309]